MPWFRGRRARHSDALRPLPQTVVGTASAEAVARLILVGLQRLAEGKQPGDEVTYRAPAVLVSKMSSETLSFMLTMLAEDYGLSFLGLDPLDQHVILCRVLGPPAGL